MLFGFLMLGLGFILLCMRSSGKIKCSRVLLIALMVFGCGYPIYKLPAKGAPNGDPEMARLFLILCILDLVIIIITEMSINKNRQKAIAIKQEEIRMEKMHNIAKDIFSKCEEKKMNSFETENQKKNLEIIARSFGIEGYEEARKYYELGEKLHKQARNNEREQEIRKQREIEYKQFEEDKNKAQIKGRDKYTAELKKSIASGIDTLEWMQNFGKDAGKLGKQSDWAIMGGMADGIAGPAAGIAVALDVQKKNEESANLAKAAKGLSNSLNKSAPIIAAGIQTKLKLLENFNRKVCDETGLEEKFSYLRMKDITCELLSSGNISVCYVMDIVSEVNLLGEKAVLDGSFLVKVKDSNGEVVAQGYYSAPGFNEMDMEKVGFKEKMVASTLCKVQDYNKEIDIDNCTVSFDAVNMWIIEK